MPFIPRQVKPPARQVLSCRLPEETASLLKRYADFLESTQEYVVNETLLVAFRRDKEFQAWLAGRPVAPTQAGQTGVSPARQPERPRS